MNYPTSSFRVACALLVTGLGLLTNLDSIAPLMADESDHKSNTLHLATSHHLEQLQGFTAADAAYAEAMQEHISHLS